MFFSFFSSSKSHFLPMAPINSSGHFPVTATLPISAVASFNRYVILIVLLLIIVLDINPHILWFTPTFGGGGASPKRGTPPCFCGKKGQT